MADLRRLHNGAPDRLAVVFIHGLEGDPIETWRHPEGSSDDMWPHWIGQDTRCDTWVLGYDASLSGWTEQAMPLPHQGNQVADLLATRTELKDRRLVLVGHSMGGLVIKTLMQQAYSQGDPRVRALADRVAAMAVQRYVRNVAAEIENAGQHPGV